MSYETIECADGAKFLEVLAPWNPRWWGPQRQSRPELHHASSWWFRGQADASWKLTPSAYRNTAFVTHPFSDFFRSLPEGSAPSLIVQTEWSRLRDFVHAADAQGVYLPEDSYALRKRWFARDSWRAPYDLVNVSGGGAWPPEELLPLMAFAQHHGVPTRLLDWSKSPFVAAYFSAASTLDSESMCVWAVDTFRIRNAATLEAIEVPYAPNSNLVKQKGAFTLDRSEPPLHLDDISWNVLHDELAPLVKVTTPVSQRPFVLGWLSNAGFDRATLFTGGDAIASYAIEELERLRMAGPVRT